LSSDGDDLSGETSAGVARIREKEAAMDRHHHAFPGRRRFRRRMGMIALAAVLGTTVYGDNHGLARSDVVSPVSRALGIGESLGRAASGFSRIAGEAAALGVLYGTVLSPMDPRVRRSILAAIDGIREVCTGRSAELPVSRCAARHPRAPKSVRCNRA
jgi:hypothetical protein